MPDDEPSSQQDRDGALPLASKEGSGSSGQRAVPAAMESVAEAEVTADASTSRASPLGRLGRPLNWRSPFLIAAMATAGIAVTYAVIQLLVLAAPVLLLIGIALFLAVGIEPAVAWQVRHKVPRWAGVLIVMLIVLGAVAGFIAVALPAVINQGQQLVTDVPTYLKDAQDKNTFIGGLNEKIGLQDKITSLLSSADNGIAGGLLTAGVAVFSAVTDGLIVMVLTVYFLVDMPRIRALIYRLFPHSRRPRAILIGDDILRKVGAYVLGNLLVSLIAGVLTFGWLLIFGVPYALLLAILVALLDLVPVVGSTIAGIIVALVALTVSLPVCLATIGFFIVYRFLEDYLLIPRIIGRAVDVPALVTVVAVLIGAALLGVIGALVAIPFAAALLLLAREILFPRLDQI
ncbi:MAG: AI-2E family transporter [Nakamurella sp.]